MAPMTRRRSARLASNSKPCGGAATPGLDSLAEQHEADECNTRDEQPAPVPPRTPASSSPAKPSGSEMHPGKAKANAPREPPSSALRLGFADIRAVCEGSPTTAKTNKTRKMDPPVAVSMAALAAATTMLPDTPSHKRSPLSALSPFTFRFSRPGHTHSPSAFKTTTAHEEETAAAAAAASTPQKAGGGAPDLGLSDEARRMMDELREEAQKIRADLEAQRALERAAEDSNGPNGRKIAKPKSRAGRFSAAHTAEFSKMDSIANHPSAFRAARSTPVRATAAATTPAATPALAGHARGLKRTQSKANLDDARSTPAVPASASASTPKKRHNPLFGHSNSSSNSSLGLSGSAGDSQRPASSASSATTARKTNPLFPAPSGPPMSAAKRLKQHVGDDASSSRPMSRDGSTMSALPRPTATTNGLSGLTRSHTTASLVTPTKASLARSATAGALPGTESSQPPKTPSKTPSKTPTQLFSALKRSATTNSLQASGQATVRLVPPASETEKAGRPKANAPTVGTTARSTLPAPIPMAPAVMAFSKTPAPPRAANQPLPRFPATTPRRKLVKRVAFTPVTQRAVLGEKSPSLFRSGIPRSALKSTSSAATHAAQRADVAMDASDDAFAAGASASPSVGRRFGTPIFYPDLSGHELLRERSGSAEATATPAPSVPGTFTFRSDKTISFGPKSPTGFGSSPGQASLRQVRSSTLGMPKLPGSFPGSSVQGGDMFTAMVATDGPNKENTRPVAVSIIPHGIANKKRHRISEAEEEAEQQAAERAAKKRKNEPVPEGEALLAPRLMAKGSSTTLSAGGGSVRSTPRKIAPVKQQPSFSGAAGGKTPGSVVRKRPVLSLSRLNSLALPKLRK